MCQFSRYCLFKNAAEQLFQKQAYNKTQRGLQDVSESKIILVTKGMVKINHTSKMYFKTII